MESETELARRFDLQVVRTRRCPRVLLVDGDLGRRATLAVALGTRYAVETSGSRFDAQRRAATGEFDVVVLDAGTLARTLPHVVRTVRSRVPVVRVLVIAERRDLRGRHYATSLGVEATLGRRAPASTLVDRIAALVTVEKTRGRFDQGVGRAIDLMARDVTHLLDVNALADATGVPLPSLARRFHAETGLTVHEFVTRVRVTVAEQLLRDTDLSVATLADLLGFADADELAREAGLRAPEA